jgi:ribosomal protein S18 acetylase RimI-like enzyme
VMEVRLRDARAEDQEAIREVTLASYQQYAETLGPLWALYRENIVSTLASVAPAEQIVAEGEGAIVGAVLLYPGRGVEPGGAGAGPVATKWPEVRLLAVRPAARGRGIAEALMRECVRRARAAGAAALTLHTTDMMEAAVRLYKRMGFTRDPGLDWSPAPTLTVKGFRLSLRGVTT